MIYNVYNPFTGENTKVETAEEVNAIVSGVLKNFIDEHKIVVNVIDVQANGDETWLTHTTPQVDSSAIQLIGQDPNLTQEQKIAWILEERNTRLAASDWTQLPDVITLHDDTWLTNWRTYRQALRDLPETLDIDNPVYPVPPL
jgi:hypothetical protein